MTKTYLKTLAPYHQNKGRSRYELIGLTVNEKLLEIKEGIKACVNQFKVRKTHSENSNDTYLCSAISRSVVEEHEREELQSTSGENKNGSFTINADETLPAVVEVATQTQKLYRGKRFCRISKQL